MPEDTVARVERLLDAAMTERAPLESLLLIYRLRRVLDARESRAMYAARVAERDWAEIGAALDMSGQAASKRARQRHQLTDPRIDPDTGRPPRRSAYLP